MPDQVSRSDSSVCVFNVSGVTLWRGSLGIAVILRLDVEGLGDTEGLGDIEECLDKDSLNDEMLSDNPESLRALVANRFPVLEFVTGATRASSGLTTGLLGLMLV